MSSAIEQSALVAGTAFALVLLTTPLVRRAARRLGAVSYPKEDRWHRRPVPLLGGVGLFIGIAGSMLLYGAHDPVLVPLAAAAAGMFALGVADDLWKLKPNTKLTAQIAIACLVVLLGGMAPWTGWLVTDSLLAIVWIVVITNAFNLLDNMDGLCAGIAAIAGIACWLGLLSGPPTLGAGAAAIAGASAGFLVFNFKPASIFMGDAGSLFLGGSLAVLTLIGGAQAGTGILSAIAVPVFLLLIPLFDTTFVTLSRILSTRSASTGGRDHTSHRLVAMGFSEREAVLILYFLASLGGAAAVLGGSSSTSDALLLGPLLIVGLTLLGIQLARVRVYDGEDFSLLLGKRYTPLLVDVAYKRRVFEVLLDALLVSFSYYAAYVVRFDREAPIYYDLLAQSMPIVLGCQLSSLFVVGVYRGTWRYVSLADLTIYGKGIALGVLSTVLVLVYLYRFEGYSRGVFVIHAMLMALLLVGTRLSFRIIGDAAGRHRRSGQAALIYGAGDAGALLVRELRNNSRYDLLPIAFLDDDESKRHKRVMGLAIEGGFERATEAIAEHRPTAVIVSTEKLPADRLESLRALCYESGTRLLQLRFRLDEVSSATEPHPK